MKVKEKKRLFNEFIRHFAKNCCEIMEIDPTYSMEAMAKDCGRSQQTVRRYLIELGYGSFTDLLDSIRKDLIEILVSKDIDDVFSLSKRLGFDDFRSLYRFTSKIYQATPSIVIDNIKNKIPEKKLLYVVSFTNGVVKFGVTNDRNRRFEAIKCNHLVREANINRQFSTELREDYSKIENILIGKYRDFSIGCSREWLENISFDQVALDAIEMTKSDAEKLNLGEITKSAIDSGFSNIMEVCTLSGIEYMELKDWHKNKPERFKLAIDAALYRKGKR